MSETPESDGRWRRLQISSALLSEIFRGEGTTEALYDAPRVRSDAPADLTFVGLSHVQSGPTGWYTFVVWSASFEPLPMTDGRLHDEIPLISFRYEAHR